MGSCFADVMGERMKRHKFNILINPFGVLYHPMALFRVIHMSLDQSSPDPSSYLSNQDVYYNYHFHSKMAHSSLEELEKIIGQTLQETAQLLQQSPVLILTFGTAFQYTLKEQNLKVANCHKQPAQLFDKQLSTVDELLKGFMNLMDQLEGHQLIVSVSPVRHLKDGLVENNLSKSVLRLACHHMADTYPNVHYFPGYEIVMDDLRDYRFYGKDMIHPNEIAHDYIWDLFVEHYLDSDTREFLAQWQQIDKNLKHRAFHEHSTAHQNFLKKTLSLLEQIPPYIDVEAEIHLVKKQLL